MTKELMQAWDARQTVADELQAEHKRRTHPIRLALASAIHDALYADAFNEDGAPGDKAADWVSTAEYEYEVHDGADAVIAAFPNILDMTPVDGIPPRLSAKETITLATNPIRAKLAQVVHDGMYVRAFDPNRDVEAWDAADAVLAVFPELLK